VIETIAGPVREEFDAARLNETGHLLYQSVKQVEKWVEEHRYEAYEPFDGLSSPLGRLTRCSQLLDRLLQQTGRQSPVNVRPLLGIKPLPSTKGRGYMAAGYLALYELTGQPEYRRKAVGCLEWLMENKSPKFHEYDSTWSAPPVAGVTFAVNVNGCPWCGTAVPAVAVIVTDNGGRFPTVTAVVATTDSPVFASRPVIRMVYVPADV